MLILLVNMLGLFLLKDKKCVSILNAFRKRIKIWVDKESKSYNSSFKKWLKDNDIEIYSLHKEEKSVVC